MSVPRTSAEIEKYLRDKYKVLRTHNGGVWFCKTALPHIACSQEEVLELELGLLAIAANDENEKPVRDLAVRQGFRAFVARASEGPRATEPRVRAARRGGALYLFLADQRHRVVRINKEGWKVRSQVRPVFRNSTGGMPLPVPVSGGDLRELQQLLNVSDEQWPTLLAWLLCALDPETPQPILWLEGPYGCGKSSLASFVQKLIAPTTVQRTEMPGRTGDWSALLNSVYVVVVDNSGDLKPSQSNWLCLAATGGSVSARRQYTDGELYAAFTLNPVIFTTLETSVPLDVASRQLPLAMPFIEHRRLEEDMQAEFDAGHAGWLGALLDLAVDCLAVDNAELEEAEARMADYERWLMRVDAVLETSGLQTYRDMIGNASQREVRADPILAAVIAFTERVDRWDGTITELLAAMPTDENGWQFDISAGKMGKKLRTAEPALRAAGVKVTRDRSYVSQSGGTARRVALSWTGA